MRQRTSLVAPSAGTSALQGGPAQDARVCFHGYADMHQACQYDHHTDEGHQVSNKSHHAIPIQWLTQGLAPNLKQPWPVAQQRAHQLSWDFACAARSAQHEVHVNPITIELWSLLHAMLKRHM